MGICLVDSSGRLCKAIVEAHDGTVRLESDDGRGATFLVELPFLPAPVAAGATMP
jgi:signal transduction histidine kinase